MFGFSRENDSTGFSDISREMYEEIIQEKDRLISVSRRDVESLKREIVSLKKQLDCSKRKRK